LTGLKIGDEELKYYDLTKLEDTRYGIFKILFCIAQCEYVHVLW